MALDQKYLTCSKCGRTAPESTSFFAVDTSNRRCVYCQVQFLELQIDLMIDTGKKLAKDLEESNRLVVSLQKIVDALKGVPLCAKCHGEGFWLYMNSDGSGADRYDCVCKPLLAALAAYKEQQTEKRKDECPKCHTRCCVLERGADKFWCDYCRAEFAA